MCLVGTDKPMHESRIEPFSGGLYCMYLDRAWPVKPEPPLKGFFFCGLGSDRDTAIQDVSTSYAHGGISTRGCKSRSKSGVTRTLERDIQTVRKDKAQVVSDYGIQSIGYTDQAANTCKDRRTVGRTASTADRMNNPVGLVKESCIFSPLMGCVRRTGKGNYAHKNQQGENRDTTSLSNIRYRES